MSLTLTLALVVALLVVSRCNWGAIIGAVIGLGGSYLASENAEDAKDDANRATDADRERGFAWIDEFLGQMNAEFFRAEQVYRDRLKLTASAAQAEQLLIADQGNAALQAIERREAQQIGDVRSSMQSRGLGASTVGASLERGVRSDTDRSLTALSEQLTAQRANALRYGTASTAGAMGDLAQIGLSRQSAMAQALSSRLNLIQGTQIGFDASSYQMQANAWGNLGGAIAAWKPESDSDTDDEPSSGGGGWS
jgi:hypothetical protein